MSGCGSGAEGGGAGLAVGGREGDGVRRVAGVAVAEGVDVDLAVLVGGAGAREQGGVVAGQLDLPLLAGAGRLQLGAHLGAAVLRLGAELPGRAAARAALAGLRLDGVAHGPPGPEPDQDRRGRNASD